MEELLALRHYIEQQRYSEDDCAASPPAIETFYVLGWMLCRAYSPLGALQDCYKQLLTGLQYI
jgi:hypothetical protein